MKRIIFYAISLYTGMVWYVAYKNVFLISVIIILIYFFMLKKIINKKDVMFGMILVIFAVININNYYNIKIYKTEIIRIETVGYYSKGTISNCYIDITGDIKNIKKGEKILAKGSFQRKMNFTYGSVGTFSIESYIKLDDDLKSKIEKYKEKINLKLENSLGNKRASIISALVLGDTSKMDREDKGVFSKLGISHVISISGLHMILIYGVFEKILGVKLALITSFLYVVFIGGKVSISRAFIMILILKISPILKRKYNRDASIAASAIILLNINPSKCTNLSFILSFGAVIGISKFSNKIKEILIFLPRILQESIAISISSQILTIPIIMGVLNSFNIGFILGNILLLPFFSILVILGIISIITIPIDNIYNIFISIIKIFMFIIEGGMSFLEKITPNLCYANYMTSIYYILIIFVIIYYSIYKKILKKTAVFITFAYMLILINPIGNIYLESVCGKIAIVYRSEIDSKIILNDSINLTLDKKEILNQYGCDNLILLDGKTYLIKDKKKSIKVNSNHINKKNNGQSFYELDIKNKNLNIVINLIFSKEDNFDNKKIITILDNKKNYRYNINQGEMKFNIYFLFGKVIVVRG